LLLGLPAHAQNTLQATLDDYLRKETQGLPGKVTYSIGQLDARTQLAPCAAFEPFLPTGGRLWGKATVGVRCLGPANWTVYVPVQVNVAGDYLISARTLPAGYVVGAADIVVRSGDLAKLPANVITDPAQAIGRTVKNGFAAGQPLRSDQLVTQWAVQQGQNVKTVSNGAGFSVSSEGKALSNAMAGQLVQVRTNSGQTVSGIARPGGIVEVTQ
jgi:flagella basal body P-ring formation protein FlgA